MTSVQESSLEMNQWCSECGAAAGDQHKMSCDSQYKEMSNRILDVLNDPEAMREITKKATEAQLKLLEEVDVVDEDWLSGVSCNPNAPEECESCQ